MLRFLHCADLHYDRSFEGLHRLSDLTDEFSRANEQVLETIVNGAIEQEVDFVLFAGDTFHQNRPSLKTQHQFFTQMNRLNKVNIPVYLSFGNHDFYEKERYWFDFPSNLFLFSQEKVTTLTAKTKQGESYAISGFSYEQPLIHESKVPEFPTRQATYHIGMYHGEYQGASYAPFQVQEMKQKNYDYWALGHIHVPTTVSENPPIIYPGTPQGHTQKETEVKGVCLVTLDAMQATVEWLDVASIAFMERVISLKNIRHLKGALEQIESVFQTSEATLLKLTLTETDNLPQEWLSEKEVNEMIAYLNRLFESKGWKQRIFKIVESGTTSEKLQLNGKVLLTQLLDNYAKIGNYTQVTEELVSHSIMERVIDVKQLQNDSLHQVKQRFETEFYWREDQL